MRFSPQLLTLATPLLLSACDECAGTPSCNVAAEISYSGQFIEHKSGTPVPGVSITFVRQGGVEIAGGTLRAVSDAEGFFVLRAGVLQQGKAYGDLQVVPPAPYQPYTIPAETLVTNTVRGDGGNFGRLVVNPYLLLVGHVRDRTTLVPLPGAIVTLRRTGGGRVERDSMTFTTDFGGQFSWEPAILQPETIDAVFEIDAPGYPRKFVVPRAVPIKHRDLDMSFVILPVGWGLSYSGEIVRRGSDEPLPRATVAFRRTGGVGTEPERANLIVDAGGTFFITAERVEPLSEGTVTAELRIVPPLPLSPDTISVQLQTSDDDQPRSLGFFRFGAQAYLVAELREAGSDQPLAEHTRIQMKRTGGLPLAWSDTVANPDLRNVKAGGRIEYQAPTPDSGAVQFDVIVQLPAPFAWDTIRNVSVPARYSDTPTDAGVLLVRRRVLP